MSIGKIVKEYLRRRKVTEFDLRSRSRKKMSGPDAQELADGKTNLHTFKGKVQKIEFPSSGLRSGFAIGNS